MFKSGDRGKLLAYLGKKPSYHAGEQQERPTGQVNNSQKPRQHVSPARGGKSDDARKRLPPTTSQFTDRQQNGQQLDGTETNLKKKNKSNDQICQEIANESAAKVPPKKNNKGKNRGKIAGQEQNGDKIVSKATKLATLPSKSSTKRTLKEQSEFEKSLSHDVKNMLADFKDGGGQFEAGEQDFDDDFLDEEEEDIVPKAKKGKKKQFDDPEEVSRRSTELGQKARQTLATSMFRSLNEFLYCHDSNQTRREFTASKFRLYHQAYDKLMDDWPLKPIDYLINVLKKRLADPKKLSQSVIGDVGCGSRPQIADAFPTATVHSYDLHQNDPTDVRIIAADMSRLSLDSDQCDFVVYSLSLMPTNLKECVREANRILKMGGYMLIVEVASRFADYKISSGRRLDQEKHVGHGFALDLKSYGFQLTEHEELKPNAFFVYLCFKKTGNAEQMAPKSKLPALTLKACVYKAR